MNVDGTHYRTVWLDPEDDGTVRIIDQRKLPFQFVIEEIRSVAAAAVAIRDMHVRGAGCIGGTAGFGMYLAALEAARDEDFEKKLIELANELLETRPTAMNLAWAVERQLRVMGGVEGVEEKVSVAKHTAQAIADEELRAILDLKHLKSRSERRQMNTWIGKTSPVFSTTDTGCSDK